MDFKFLVPSTVEPVSQPRTIVSASLLTHIRVFPSSVIFCSCMCTTLFRSNSPAFSESNSNFVRSCSGFVPETTQSSPVAIVMSASETLGGSTPAVSTDADCLCSSASPFARADAAPARGVRGDNGATSKVIIELASGSFIPRCPRTSTDWPRSQDPVIFLAISIKGSTPHERKMLFFASGFSASMLSAATEKL